MYNDITPDSSLFDMMDFMSSAKISCDAISTESFLDNALEGVSDIGETKERKDLPKRAFGVQERRLYPLNHPDLVKNAIKYFKYCNKSDRAELAKNIIKAAQEFKMKIKITPHNPLRAYVSDPKIIDENSKLVTDPNEDKNKFNTK